MYIGVECLHGGEIVVVAHRFPFPIEAYKFDILVFCGIEAFKKFVDLVFNGFFDPLAARKGFAVQVSVFVRDVYRNPKLCLAVFAQDFIHLAHRLVQCVYLNVFSEDLIKVEFRAFCNIRLCSGEVAPAEYNGIEEVIDKLVIRIVIAKVGKQRFHRGRIKRVVVHAVFVDRGGKEYVFAADNVRRRVIAVG